MRRNIYLTCNSFYHVHLTYQLLVPPPPPHPFLNSSVYITYRRAFRQAFVPVARPLLTRLENHLRGELEVL